jgi:hypothetical protein
MTRQVLRYVSGRWTLAEKSESVLNASEKKMLRRILVPLKGSCGMAVDIAMC